MKSFYFGNLVIIIYFLFNKINTQRFLQQAIESHQLCSYDNDCKENSFCYGNNEGKKGVCRCKANFYMHRNWTFYECLNAVKLGDPCETDFQCIIIPGPMAICNKYKICECNELAHQYTDGLCYKTRKLKQKCLSDANCKLENGFAFCTDGFCECSINERPSLNFQKCLPSKNLGEHCLSDEECELIPNASCEGFCMCKIDYVLSRNDRDCLKAAIKFGDSCTENLQCSKFLTDSVCVQENCTCLEGYHAYGQKCIQSKRSKESCSGDAECVFHKLLQNKVQCSEGVCKCLYGENNSFYGCNLKGFGNLIKPTLQVKLFVFLAMFVTFLTIN